MDNDNKAIRLIVASQLTETDFYTQSPLGMSLSRLAYDGSIYCHAVCNNTGASAIGLGEIYNRFIDQTYRDDILVFVHDDVAIDDYFIRHRLNDALRSFDVVGVAGNVDADENDVSWYFQPSSDNSGGLEKIADDKLSGAVAHSQQNQCSVTYYGKLPASCQRLDGCFIAVNTEKLLSTGVKFDEQFRFHFYDLDFSRACYNAGLKLGTWPIAIIHHSGGAFGSPAWQAACADYIKKWHAA